MITNGITTKIIQSLSDTSGSILPIAAKDTLSNCSITYIYDKKGSKEDGKEKALEEFGTMAIWLGGIPLLKKLFDKTVYKKLNLDPNFDIRKLKQGATDSLEFSAKSTKDVAQKEFLENLINNPSLQKTYKQLHVAKFAVATATSLAALSGLIMYKQHMTNKELEQKVKEKFKVHTDLQNEIAGAEVFNAVSGKGKKDDKNLAFKGSSALLSQFMYNPVMNMSILDAGITTTRLAQARKGERFEVGFKEFFQILFIYGLASPIQKGLEALSKKIFNVPIETQYQMLSSNEAHNHLKSKELSKHLDDFLVKGKLDGDQAKKSLEYIYNNSDNPLVKLLKISGDLPTTKAGEIDSLAHIDANKLQKAAENIKKLVDSAPTKGMDDYLKKVKQIKGASVIANVVVGAIAIGVLQPLMTIFFREAKGGDSKNPAIVNIENQMLDEMKKQAQNNEGKKV